MMLYESLGPAEPTGLLFNSMINETTGDAGDTGQLLIIVLAQNNNNIYVVKHTLNDSLEQLFRRNGDDSAELLKVDIEGAEHSTIVPFITKYEVCQVNFCFSTKSLFIWTYPMLTHVPVAQQIPKLKKFRDSVNPLALF
uniref:Methyltransf_21 domain-containing protein n=1 Tax=Angiostrongylus cantonensis TaxID=6313 RepID=A0A0K0CTU8_ANGCA